MRVLLLLVVTGCHCGASTLSSAQPKVTAAPGALAFVVYVGASSTQSVAVANGGEAGDNVTATLNGGGPFSTSATSISLGPGSTSVVPVTFAPTAAGSFTATLALQDSAGTLDVAITGTALAPLTCTPSGPCDTAVFVADAGACVVSTLADGISCDSLDPCLVNTQCVGGACLGTPNACDDGNACTQDFCVEGQGCQHLDTTASCNGTAPCQVYGCDPATGCTQANAVDGTACSLDDSCQSAELCVLGKCVGTQVPDGTPCKLWWEPCVDAGCLNGVCHDAVAEAEVPGQLRWTAPLPGANGPFAIDDAGVAYVTGSVIADGGIAGGALVALDVCGRQLWTNTGGYYYAAMIDGDQVIGIEGFSMVGIQRATGATLWTLPASAPVVTGLPVMSNQGQLFFVTQLADGGVSLAAALRNGTIDWVLPLQTSMGGYFVATDRAGNVYLSTGDPVDQGALDVAAYSPSGTLLWSSEAGTACAADGTPAVAEGAMFAGGLELSLDGGAVLASSAILAASGVACIGGPSIVDSAGDLIGTAQLNSGGRGFASSAPGEVLRWSVVPPIQAYPLQPTLASDGTVFLSFAGYPGAGTQEPLLQIFAIRGDAGTIAWGASAPLAAGFSPFVLMNGMLLSPAGSLEVANGMEVNAYFAGKVTPPADAPWYTVRGTNDGRGAPAP